MKHFIFDRDIEILYKGTKKERLEVLKQWRTEFEITDKLVLPENIKNIPVEKRVELYNNNTTVERELFFIVGSRRGNYAQHWAWNENQYDTPFIFKTPTIRKLFIENNEEEMIEWFKNNSTYQ